MSGLVGPHLLRGHDDVEVDGEVVARGGEKIVVDVGKDAEAAYGCEPFERRVGVGKLVICQIAEKNGRFHENIERWDAPMIDFSVEGSIRDRWSGEAILAVVGLQDLADTESS